MQQNVNYQKELEKVIGSLGVSKPRLLLHACCAPCSSYCLEYLREYFDITVFYYNPNITGAAEYEKREAEEKRLIETYNKQVIEQNFSGTNLDKAADEDFAGAGSGKQVADEDFAGAGSGKQVADEDFAGAGSGKQVASENFAGMNSTPHAGIIHIVDAEYDPDRYLETVKGLENEPEGGARCAKCFEMRLRRTIEEAVKLDADYVTTTLTISPLKNASLLNSIGMRLAEEYSHKSAGGHGVKWLPSDFKKKGGFQRSIVLSHEYGLYRQNYCGCVFSRSEER